MVPTAEAAADALGVDVRAKVVAGAAAALTAAMGGRGRLAELL